MLERNEKKRSRWLVPGVALLIGVAYFVANWIGGNPSLGVAMLAIMVLYAAVLLLGGRSEVVRVLRGQPSDERYRSFDLRATAFAGVITILVLIGGFLLELSRGGDGQPYSALLAIAGVSYLAGLLWLRYRS